MTKLRVTAFLTLLITLCPLSFKAFAANQPAADFRFTILHTNDLHAHDEPFADRGRTVGGMAKIAHVIRSIKAKDPNVLTIDAGDIFQGTPFFKFYHGQIEVQMLNDAGYDIYTIGNHEFDDGAANLAQQLKNAHFDVINANMDTSAVPQLQAVIKPSTVKTVNGQKVGFIGAVVPNLTEVSLRTDGVKIKSTGKDWMEPIKLEIEKLKSQGVDKIVLVTHCGLELDKQLAALPDVDVIVGGHSHTRLDVPVIVDHSDGTKCVIVQTGCYGRALGKLELTFTNDGKLELPQTRYRLISINDKVQEEPDIKAYLQQKAQPFEKMRRTIVSNAAADFDNAFRRYPWDSSIGNLIADALAQAGTTYGATIAFQNRGGIRSRIERGPISEQTIDEILPFENHLIVATISGDTLLKVLENSVAGDNYGAKFLDVHGLKFAYDHDKSPFHRVVWAQAQGHDGKWKDVDSNQQYRVAVNDYSFKGGEGYDFSKATDVKDTGQRLSVFLTQYLKQHSTIAPQPPSRIVPVNGNLASLGNGSARSKADVVVRTLSSGARVYILRGKGKDIGLLQGAPVPVPLKEPKIITSIATGKGKSEVHIPVSIPKNANEEFVAVVVPKRAADAAIISTPLVLK